MRFLTTLAALALAGLAQIAPATAQTAPAPAAQAAASRPAPAAANAATLQGGYIVGINDSLDISMVGSEEFRGRVQVQQDGTIQLPYVGSLKAQDKTLLQLGKEIAAALDRGLGTNVCITTGNEADVERLVGPHAHKGPIRRRLSPCGGWPASGWRS
ncbi:polysaccharide biosynthesis/export family protein [uncultured Arthrobacter sp.]|uniref:polysaccharide biosynthesis/export family protein n=1 Tax=uncultured Arthrobacter sp. TaxID=114050 RepID=UPI0032176C92